MGSTENLVKGNLPTIWLLLHKEQASKADIFRIRWSKDNRSNTSHQLN